MAKVVNWDDCPVGARVLAKLEDIHEDIKQQNGRIRKNEIKIASITGGVLALAFIVPLIWKYVL